MSTFRSAAAALFLIALVAPLALAQDAPQTRVVLQSGDVLTGRLVSESDSAVVIDHATLGVITLPRENVSQLFTVAPDHTGAIPPAVPTTEGEPEPAPAAAEQPTPEPAEKSPWTGGVELGLSGSEGNTEDLNLRAGANFTRELPKETLELKFLYIYETDSGDVTEHEFTGLVRQTWKLDNPRWGVFLEGFAEYDEFERYDWLFRLTPGLSYKFIDRENETLIGRIGVGPAYEVNSDRDLYWTGLLGLDYTRNFANGVDLALGTEYRPEFDEFGEFELRSYASLDFALGHTDDWKLRTGVQHKYLSDSGDARNWDLDYFIALVYEF